MAAKSTNKSITWTASEYIDHQRGFSWYLLLAVGVVIAAFALWFINRDIFSPSIVVIIGVIVGSVAHWKPRQVEYILTSESFQAGERQYSLHQFKAFTIKHESDLSSLTLLPTKRLMPPIVAFIDDEDAQRVVEVLADSLPMVDDHVDRMDNLARRLRF